jgi:hypothetical protein
LASDMMMHCLCVYRDRPCLFVGGDRGFRS